MSDTLTAISPRDARAQKQVDALLEREGIRRDAHLDYTCGIFDDDWKLIATGSCYGCTLRCFAVSDEHRGEGLLNQVVSHLIEVQLARGNRHIFLYTKPQSVRFFGDLGFYEIARTGNAVFMENRRDGFASYCDAEALMCEAYADKERWNRMSLINIARSGIFAADRAVAEYADNIWHVPHR